MPQTRIQPSSDPLKPDAALESSVLITAASEKRRKGHGWSQAYQAHFILVRFSGSLLISETSPLPGQSSSSDSLVKCDPNTKLSIIMNYIGLLLEFSAGNKRRY